MKRIIILPFLFFALGCSDSPPDTRPKAEVQSAIAIDDATDAVVLTLPSGERILYARMRYTGSAGGYYYAISTTLLPPLPVERKP